MIMDKDMCTFCIGTGEYHLNLCPKCGGAGVVDWIEQIVGVHTNKYKSVEAKRVADDAGGGGILSSLGGGGTGAAYSHHSHQHMNSGTIGLGPSISSIQGGPGVIVSNSQHHVSSSQSGYCSTVDNPSIEIDIPFIKEELKDWIEEHIKNEVSKRVHDELIRRGVK